MASNFAQERLQQMRDRLPKEEPLPAPPLDGELIAWLITAFPPRCYNHTHETLEDHLKYAGKVELVQELLEDFRHQQEETVTALSDISRGLDAEAIAAALRTEG